jgi:hypothetical protein
LGLRSNLRGNKSVRFGKAVVATHPSVNCLTIRTKKRARLRKRLGAKSKIFLDNFSKRKKKGKKTERKSHANSNG